MPHRSLHRPLWRAAWAPGNDVRLPPAHCAAAGAFACVQAVSAVKGSLEEHAQRLRERADVTQSLRKWAEQVLEEAARWAGVRTGGSPGREWDIAMEGGKDMAAWLI